MNRTTIETAFAIGDRVEFHSQHPFEVHAGTVTGVGIRKRNGFGAPKDTETFVVVQWDPCQCATCRENGPKSATVATWNRRLQAAKPMPPTCDECGMFEAEVGPLDDESLCADCVVEMMADALADARLEAGRERDGMFGEDNRR